MPDSPLTFKQVKGKFALINVRFVDPYQDGNHSYFVGPDASQRPYDFPYATGPRSYASGREVVPLTTITTGYISSASSAPSYKCSGPWRSTVAKTKRNNTTSEYSAFERALQLVLTVPKAELERRLTDDKRAKKQKRSMYRASRASCAKD